MDHQSGADPKEPVNQEGSAEHDCRADIVVPGDVEDQKRREQKCDATQRINPMLAKSDGYGRGNLDQSLDYQEYGERIQRDGERAIAQIEQDGNPDKHPDDACRSQELPDGFQRTRPKKKKDQPDHDAFR
ncbi:hypothetical protein [Mesorhizobium sp. M0199]|uniref:hypothetical protein n=1 Tax=Mesorhizobium sp. M0199 TaxID=2956911 RepID=UPI003336451D